MTTDIIVILLALGGAALAHRLVPMHREAPPPSVEPATKPPPARTEPRVAAADLGEPVTASEIAGLVLCILFAICMAAVGIVSGLRRIDAMSDSWPDVRCGSDGVCAMPAERPLAWPRGYPTRGFVANDYDWTRGADWPSPWESADSVMDPWPGSPYACPLLIASEPLAEDMHYPVRMPGAPYSDHPRPPLSWGNTDQVELIEMLADVE